MEKYYLYVHINKLNNKVYVGITRQSLNNRWRNGHGYKKCILFNRAIEKYGWDTFKHIKLFSNLSKEVAHKLERMYISRYKKRNLSYNIGLGGEGTNSFSEETINKLKKYKGPLSSQYGNKLSKEEKEKRALITKRVWNSYNEEERKNRINKSKNKVHRGEQHYKYNNSIDKKLLNKLIEINSKAINCYDLLGNYITTFNSITEASNILKIDDSHISSCALGKRKSSQGYQWRYFDSNTCNIPPVSSKIIILLDNNENEIKQFSSIKEAADYVGKHYTCIANILKGKTRKPYSGLNFKYKEL